MREALFSQDGWGCQHVNQDTNWEVPSSPEPTNKDQSGPPLWKPTINNGTDLWETNLRNGGQPPPTQSVQKTPWGHTPSSNLGGTWGEDDDGNDTSNVWTGGGGGGGGGVGVGVGPGVGVGVVNPSAAVGGVAGVAATTVAVGGGPPNGPQWSQSGVNAGGVNVAPVGGQNAMTSAPGGAGNLGNVPPGG